MAIDTATNTIDDSLTGLNTNTRGITISDDGSRIYVANHPDSVTVISTRPPAPSPDPAPATPAGPPLDVTAEPGDRTAAITWAAPSVSGSFPITHYQAMSTPGGHSCLVSVMTTTCRVSGLSNGVAYTFTVRALNGAGWSSASASSLPVTPVAPVRSTILISGSRDIATPRVVRVSGVTTGLVGDQVTPWIRQRGQSAYRQGSGVRTVADDGTFEWTRRSGKAISVYFMHGQTKSNVIGIPAR